MKVWSGDSLKFLNKNVLAVDRSVNVKLKKKKCEKGEVSRKYIENSNLRGNIYRMFLLLSVQEVLTYALLMYKLGQGYLDILN